MSIMKTLTASLRAGTLTSSQQEEYDTLMSAQLANLSAAYQWLTQQTQTYEPLHVVARLKQQSSITRKLREHKSMRLDQMQDVQGLRVILPTMRELEALLKQLNNLDTLQRICDYALNPTSSGYVSVHVILKYAGHLLEIQLRTPIMNQCANMMETVNRHVGSNLKSTLPASREDEQLKTLLAALNLSVYYQHCDPSQYDKYRRQVDDVQAATLITKLEGWQQYTRPTVDEKQLNAGKYHVVSWRQTGDASRTLTTRHLLMGAAYAQACQRRGEDTMLAIGNPCESHLSYWQDTAAWRTRAKSL